MIDLLTIVKIVNLINAISQPFAIRPMLRSPRHLGANCSPATGDRPPRMGPGAPSGCCAARRPLAPCAIVPTRDAGQYSTEVPQPMRTEADGDERPCTVTCTDARWWTVGLLFASRGVKGSTPLSSTGKRQNSNSRVPSTAGKYSSWDRMRSRTGVRRGASPRQQAARAGRPEVRRQRVLQSAEQEEHGAPGLRCAGPQPAIRVLESSSSGVTLAV